MTTRGEMQQNLYNKNNSIKELSCEGSALFGWCEEVENSNLLWIYFRTCFAVPFG